jgi:hypothetical protein
MIVHVPKCARPGSVAGCSTGAATTGPHRPSEGELRAGEQLLAPQQQAGLPVLARNLRVINKNTRKATVDIVIPKWEITFKGCLWHHKKGKEWTSFLSKEWVDRGGNKKYADIIAWADEATAKRFQRAALAAVRSLSGEGAP